MAFNHFSIRISLKLALLTVSLLILMELVRQPGYPVLSLLAAVLAVAQLFDVLRYVRKTNDELTRFLDAARYADFGQRFQMQQLGAGFEELGAVFTDIMERFKQTRQEQEEQLRHLKALIEHVPVPLLSVQLDGRVRLHNNAARRLFGAVRVHRLKDLRQFGDSFASCLEQIEAGERRLSNFRVDEMEKQLALVASQIMVGPQAEKLVSLQDIKSELDDAQVQAWQDLVRVLTHEIMNSITPVASLAKTARDLVDDTQSKLELIDQSVDIGALKSDLDDVKSATETVARRSDGLMQFVQNYRRLTRLPDPQKSKQPLAELFQRVADLEISQWQQSGIKLHIEVEPEGVEIFADISMMEQLLLNLLNNARQALEGMIDSNSDPQVRMLGRLNRRGHLVIEVQDNGPGINKDIADKIFMPFFTTRTEGSGVGLALTRQVMIAHGGSAALAEQETGTCVRLTF